MRSNSVIKELYLLLEEVKNKADGKDVEEFLNVLERLVSSLKKSEKEAFLGEKKDLLRFREELYSLKEICERLSSFYLFGISALKRDLKNAPVNLRV